MRILITNDDGYKAAGISALVKALQGLGELTVIAPKFHQSGMAMALSMGYKPIAVKDLGNDSGARWIYVDGTPAICVKYAIDNYYLDGKPDLVVSGINHGSNACTAACYSATLGAAQEAAINRIPAIGVSLDNISPDADFSAVIELLPDVIRRLLDAHDGSLGVFYNVNFPNLPASEIKGIRVGHMGYGHWEDEFEPWDAEHFRKRGMDYAQYGAAFEQTKEDGETFYMMTGHYHDYPENTPTSDHHLVQQAYISIVAHNFDNTDHTACEKLTKAGIEMDL